MHDTAVIVSRVVPSVLTLRAGVIERFMATVTTTVAMPNGYDPVTDAVAEYEAAQGNASDLLATHAAAWGGIWADGSIEVLPAKQSHATQAVQKEMESSTDGSGHAQPHAHGGGELGQRGYATVLWQHRGSTRTLSLW